MLETRYRALRIVSVLYKIAAVLAFGLTVLGSVAIIAQASGYNSRYYGYLTSSLITAGVSFLGGTLFAITIYAAANMIDLFVAMEENTRVAAMLLQRMATTGQPMMGAAPQMQVPQQQVWQSQVPPAAQQYAGWGAQQQPPQQR